MQRIYYISILNVFYVYTIVPFSKVAAWKDEDGDWYETGLHIFCKFIKNTSPVVNILFPLIIEEL